MTPPSSITHSTPAPENTANRFALAYLSKIKDKKARDSHLLELEALRRGLETRRFDNLTFFASPPGVTSSIGFRWTASTRTSRPTTYITTNKQVTRALLERSGVPVPAGRRFSVQGQAAAEDYARRLGWPVVVKPQAGTGGRGVTTNINSIDDLRKAIASMSRAHQRDFVIERYVAGGAYRFFVLRDRVLSAVVRRPANVVGDGTSSVAELLERQNEIRGKYHRLQTSPRPFDDGVNTELEKQGLSLASIPAAGVRVFLNRLESLSQGGDSIEVLDETHPSLLEVAVNAVRAIPGLQHAGVDILLGNHRLPRDQQDVAICEINSSPAIRSHHFPLYGPARDVAGEVLFDHAVKAGLPIDEPATQLSVDLEVRGLVARVGFRRWLAELAQEFGVSGWVRRTSDLDVLRAHISGAAGPVAAIAALAIEGPARAAPDMVRTRPTKGRSLTGEFAIRTASLWARRRRFLSRGS